MNSCRHRRLHLVCVVLLFAAGVEWTYAAPPVTTTVYPTGSFPVDANNVQAAINRGGTVLLKATNAAGHPTEFNFGPPDLEVFGGVAITTEVSILGERIGQKTTTIRGGVLSILGVAPVKCTIQGITFDGALDTPIALLRSAGANIIGNHIRGNLPLPLPIGFTEIEGIFVSGFDDPQNAITGKITVADNVIEISGGDFVNGMQFDEVAADIEVTRNTVNFMSSDGVVQSLGILVFRSFGKVSVSDNLVMMGPGNPDAVPAGIFVGGHPEARYMISHNTVITNHPNADGIDVVGFSPSISTEGATIQGNHITMQSLLPTSGGVAFVGAVRNSNITANQLEGTSGNALQVFGLNSTLTADSNHVTGNAISQLSASNGEIFLGPGSTTTLVAGQCSTYIDLGTANRILCGTPQAAALTRSRQEQKRGGAMFDKHGDAIRRARVDIMQRRLNRVEK